MKVEYTKRAIAELHKMLADSLAFGEATALKLEARVRDVISHIARYPNTGAPVAGRPGMYVVLLIRYPYKIFYRVTENAVRIVHIRHTARRPWIRER